MGHTQQHDRLPRPAGEVVDVERAPRRQQDDFGRQRGQVVPRPLPEEREPDARENPRGLDTAQLAGEGRGAAHHGGCNTAGGVGRMIWTELPRVVDSPVLES